MVVHRRSKYKPWIEWRNPDTRSDGSDLTFGGRCSRWHDLPRPPAEGIGRRRTKSNDHRRPGCLEEMSQGYTSMPRRGKHVIQVGASTPAPNSETTSPRCRRDRGRWWRSSVAPRLIGRRRFRPSRVGGRVPARLRAVPGHPWPSSARICPNSSSQTCWASKPRARS